MSARTIAKKAVRWALEPFGLVVSRPSKLLAANFVTFAKDAGIDVRTVFDVGANRGQSYRGFRTDFPAAAIHSFEPAAATFEQLIREGDGDPAFFPVHAGVGREAGRATIHVSQNSLGSTFVNDRDAVSSEDVAIVSLDDYAADRGIENIDLLKVDVEGFELEVIAGARRLLSEGRVAIAFLEVGLTDLNRLHVHFADVRAALLAHGYASLGLYDIKYWVADPFANALFACRDLLRQTGDGLTCKTVSSVRCDQFDESFRKSGAAFSGPLIEKETLGPLR